MRTHSLRVTFVISVIILVFGSSVLFFSAGISSIKNTIRKVAFNDMETEIAALKLAVNTENDEQYNFLKSLASTRIMRDPNVSFSYKQDQLDDISNNRKEKFIGLNITDMQGNSRTREGGMANFGERQYFKDAAQGKPGLFGPIINKVSNSLTIFYSYPIYDFNNKITNTYFLAMKGTFLCDLCNKYKFGQSGNTIILNRETGIMIGNNNMEDVINGVNFYEVMEKAGNTVVFLDDLKAGIAGHAVHKVGGQEFLVAWDSVPNTPWSVIFMVNWKEYNDMTKAMQLKFLGIMILVIVVGIIGAVLIGRSLRHLKTVGNAINDISTGEADLTRRIEIKNNTNEVRNVADGFNTFVEKLQHIVGTIKNSENELRETDEDLKISTDDTINSITQINSDINSVNEQITLQVNSVNETSEAVNEINTSIKLLEDLLEKQSDCVSQASAAVEQMVGNIGSVDTSVGKMVGSFSQLEENTNVGINTQTDVNERIKQIEEQSQMLQSANSAIAAIAQQTNLLAMNAAIEAAHAGEAGKGFSVVADEIRKLSETSSGQSKTIGEELNKIQESISAVAEASDKATTAFTSVKENLTLTDQVIGQIKAAMEEQQIGSKQIIESLHAMNDSTTEVKNASVKMEEGNSHIINQIQNLQNATDNMQEKIRTMNEGTSKIVGTGDELKNISDKVSESIQQIAGEIDKFTV